MAVRSVAVVVCCALTGSWKEWRRGVLRIRPSWFGTDRRVICVKG